MKAFIYLWRYELFALIVTIIVLWQMLLPGYILTLDMVFGPSHVFYMPQGFLNGLPVTVLMYLLAFVIPAWVVQKLLLIGIFFSLFYLPLKFFPKEFQVPEWAKYFAAVLYAINPFVYERMLAGQWAVLIGYALLAPLLFALLRFLRLPVIRNALWLAGALLLMGLFSIHALVMCVLFVALAIVIRAVQQLVRHDRWRFLLLLRSSVLVAVVFLTVSSYWLVPFALSHNSPIAGFGSADTTAFMTASDQYVGATGNVALLMGFWGEAYPWGQQFISPKDVGVFGLDAIALFALITIGIVVSLRRRASSKVALLLALFAVLAYIFSMGTAGIFHPVNDWLFAHVSIWRGFRDSEKWSMWLALSYAYFAAKGAGWISVRVSPRVRSAVIAILIFVPLMYSAPEIGGLYGQITPVWYPQSWYQVNAQIKDTPNCRALFLPWHLYYSLSFNHGVLTANPAAAFFDCDIIQGQNADIGSIDIDATTTDRYAVIKKMVTSSASDTSYTVSLIKNYGIQYIIKTGDLAGVDPYDYRFLTDPGITKVFESGSLQSEITLYTIGTDSPRQPLLK